MSPRGPRISVTAAISYNGLIAANASAENFEAVGFLDFLRTNITPLLRPYNGLNATSVVVMGKRLLKCISDL